MLDLPLNDAAAKVLRGWHGIRTGTGKQFKDLWLGLKEACGRAGLSVSLGISSATRSLHG